MSAKHNEWLWGWFLVAPTITGLMILNIIPIFQTAYLSLFRSGDFGRGNMFVGWENYKTMFADPQVWHATVNTLLHTVMVVPTSIVIGMVVAVLLNRNIKGKLMYRMIYFIPMMAAPAAVTMIWRWLYNNQYGLINVMLKQLGLDTVGWITDPNVTLISVSIIGVWSIVGYNMVLFLAGLQEIPQDFYEAAEIDGGSKLQQFFMITLPLVTPTLFFVAVTTIFQTMQVFDLIYMLVDITNPAYDRTVSLVYLFYNHSFRYSDKGYGSAIIMLLLAVIMVITVIQLRIQKKWVNYMG